MVGDVRVVLLPRQKQKWSPELRVAIEKQKQVHFSDISVPG